MTKSPRRILRAIVPMVAVAMLATGCSSPAAKPAAPTVDAVDPGAIDDTAVLRVVAPFPSRSLDPIKQASAAESTFTNLIYDRVLMVDTQDTIVPGLATEWAFAEDGSYLELTLRSDVKFHDGTPLDAEAVKFNLERARDTPDSSVKQNLVDIESIEAIDATTLRINLVEGRGAGLPGILTTNAGMIVSPKALAESPEDVAAGAIVAGSGPYVIDSFIPGEKSVFSKADAYWDENVGLLAGISIEYVGDAVTRLNAVRSGGADFAGISSPTDIVAAQMAAQNGEIEVTDAQFRSMMGVLINPMQGDMTDLAARQAVAHAINPEAVAALFSDRCVPRGQLYPDAEWPAIPDWEYPYPYDLKKATALAGKAGNPTLDLNAPAGSNAEQAGNAIQAMLTEAGIATTLSPLPNAEVTPRWMAGELQSFVAASMALQPDPAGTTSLWMTGGYTLARSPEAAAQIAPLAADASNPKLSQDERAALYQQIWEISMNDVWWVPVCAINSIFLHSDKVMNVDNIPWGNQGIQDFRNIAMRK